MVSGVAGPALWCVLFVALVNCRLAGIGLFLIILLPYRSVSISPAPDAGWQEPLVRLVRPFSCGIE